MRCFCFRSLVSFTLFVSFFHISRSFILIYSLYCPRQPTGLTLFCLTFQCILCIFSTWERTSRLLKLSIRYLEFWSYEQKLEVHGLMSFNVSLDINLQPNTVPSKSPKCSYKSTIESDMATYKPACKFFEPHYALFDKHNTQCLITILYYMLRDDGESSWSFPASLLIKAPTFTKKFRFFIFTLCSTREVVSKHPGIHVLLVISSGQGISHTVIYCSVNKLYLTPLRTKYGLSQISLLFPEYLQFNDRAHFWSLLEPKVGYFLFDSPSKCYFDRKSSK